MNWRIALLATLLLPAFARAHVANEGAAPAIELEISLDDEALRYQVHLPFKLWLERLAGISGPDAVAEFRALGDARRREISRAHFLDATEGSPVKINGLLVHPQIEEFATQFPEKEIDRADLNGAALERGAVRFTLRFETKGPPRRVDMVWRLYDESGGERVDGRAAVVANFLHAGKKTLRVFSAAEPGVSWHSGQARAPSSLRVAGRSGRARLRLPGLSLALLLLALPVLWIARRPRRRLPALGAALALGLGAGFAWHAEAFAIDCPLPWERELVRPPDDEAKAVFLSLHRNIYRAFDYTEESDIYDTLARSVDGPELEEIYSGVYDSLVLEEEGGAVSRVQSVDVLSTELLEEPPGVDASRPGWSLRCNWKVHGLVSHWGHTHERSTEFAATYRVAARDGAWKIVEASELRSRRLLGGRKRRRSPPIRPSFGDASP